VDSPFRSKVIKGSQNLEIGSHDPDHAHLRVVLYSVRCRGPSYISVPNLKRIALFRSKDIKGSQDFESGSRDPKPRPFST